MTDKMLKVLERHAQIEQAEERLAQAAAEIETAAALFTEAGDYHRAARSRVGAKLIRGLRRDRCVGS